MNPLLLTAVHYRINALYEVQYRVNFFIQVVHTILQTATGLVAIALVFSHTTDLGGWNRSELLAIMGVHLMVGGFVATFVRPSMSDLMFGIAEGDFDFVLVKPRDPQLIVSIRKIAVWHLSDVAVGLGVVIWAVGESDTTIDVLDVTAFGVLISCGVAIMYALWLTLTATSFRIIRVDEITQLIDGLYQTARWPVAIYPAWLRGVLTFIVPLAFAVTVPAEAVTDRLAIRTMVIAVVVASAAFMAARLFFLRQIKSYSGASA